MGIVSTVTVTTYYRLITMSHHTSFLLLSVMILAVVANSVPAASSANGDTPNEDVLLLKREALDAPMAHKIKRGARPELRCQQHCSSMGRMFQQCFQNCMSSVGGQRCPGGYNTNCNNGNCQVSCSGSGGNNNFNINGRRKRQGRAWQRCPGGFNTNCNNFGCQTSCSRVGSNSSSISSSSSISFGGRGKRVINAPTGSKRKSTIHRKTI